MKSKNIFLFAFIFSILIFSAIPINAEFTRDHLYHTLKPFDEVSAGESAIVNQCQDRVDLVLDGNTGADIFVLRYTDEEGVKSYIGTHQRSGYLRCLEEAGTDIEQKCFCYGIATHIVQDNQFHTDEGLVPKYLRLYFSSNVPGHMAIENSHEKNNLDLLKNDPIVTSGRLDFFDDIILDNVFEQTGGDVKYLELASVISGVPLNEVKRDANIFANGYKGVGFFNNVYGEKLQLPIEFWLISVGLIVLGIGAIIVLTFLKLRLKTTFWFWVLIMIYLFVAFIGIMLIISLITDNTWQWVRTSLQVIPIRVSDDDTLRYNQRAIDATKQFLITGDLGVDDASGLTHFDRDGIEVEGALHKAESSFKLLAIFFLLPLYFFTNLFLVSKTFSRRETRTGFKRFINIVGFVLLTIYILIIIGYVLLWVLT